MSDHPKESTHYYDRQGNPAYTVIGKNGVERPTTLRDARKDGLVPSVTTILKEAAKPGLQNWIIDQTILACLTLPKIEGESESDYIKRLKEDSRSQASKAAERGTQIHAWIQKGFCGEPVGEDGMRYFTSAQKCLLEAVGSIKWHCERSFATPYFGGKCDIHSDEYVIDFKSTDKDLETIKTWDEHDLQLAAYREGLGVKKAKCGILYIHVLTAESKLIWIDEEKLQRGWDMFENLLNYWYAKTGLAEQPQNCRE